MTEPVTEPEGKKRMILIGSSLREALNYQWFLFPEVPLQQSCEGLAVTGFVF